MTVPPVIDLEQLRRGCSQCSLQQLCLPAGIHASDLQQLDEIVKRRRPVDIGKRLFRRGDPLQAIYVARDGAFKTISITEDGQEQILAFHLPGELIGLDALGSGVHRVEAIALSTANVCEVPFEELSSVAAQLPSLQHQLMRVIGQSGDRDQDHAEMLVRRHASERIGLFLHGLGERLARIGQSGSDFMLPMSREDIAHFLGLAIETVSRAFARLQEDGVIAISGRRVEILDSAELDRMAHGQEALVASAKVASTKSLESR
jgi:CRP/FNR family transcriptional regulator